MENSRDKSSCDALFLRCMRETANCGMILLVAAYNTNSHIRTYKFKNLQLETLGFIISKNIFWTKYECDCVTISEARLFWKFPSWFWRYNLYYSILWIRYETLVFVIIRTDKCKSSWSLFPLLWASSNAMQFLQSTMHYHIVWLWSRPSCGGSILARRTANFSDPTCQFWLVFAGSPFRIFKKVRIILRPKFTNLNFRLPTIYINRLTRKNLETLPSCITTLCTKFTKIHWVLTMLHFWVCILFSSANTVQNWSITRS